MDIKLDITSSVNSLHVTPESPPNSNLKVEDLEAAQGDIQYLDGTCGEANTLHMI